MISNTVYFAKDLLEKNKRQFRIPVFQRNYDWTTVQCEKLYEDIIDAYLRDKIHFTGIIVYSRFQSNNVFDVDLIIDGQQRITTIHLLLKAILDVANEEKQTSVVEEIEEYLFNKRAPQDLKLKLKPVETDDLVYSNIMNNRWESQKTSNIYRNYHFFLNKVKSSLENDIRLVDIMRGIRKLQVVEVKLDQEDDNPQEIFESINSTGLDLSIADLIRNFLLMKLDDQVQRNYYNNYWFQIEKLLGTYNLADFFNDYLTCKTQEAVKSKETYSEFKLFFKTNNYSNLSMFEELVKYSKFYAVLLGIDSSGNKKIDDLTHEIRILKNTTIYPFLLNILRDYDDQSIDSNSVISILEFLINYITRRLILNLPTNVYRSLFPSLYSKIKENQKGIYRGMLEYFSYLRTNNRVPTDEEFKQELIQTNLYARRNLCNFILSKLENHGQKEKIDFDDLTIEHVLPQKKNDIKWVKEIGPNYLDVYIKYLHTLGNLTITGYNSELGTKSFKDKKEIISKYSKAQLLNKDILNADVWNETSILRRADRLSDRLVNIFKIEIEFQSQPINDSELIVTLEDGVYARGRKPIFIYKGEQKIMVSSFKDVLIYFVNYLYDRHRTEFQRLATLNYAGATGNKPFISYDEKKLRTFYKLTSENIYIETNLSASQIFYKILDLFEKFQEPIDDILIELK